MKYPTREAWLQAAISLLRPKFKGIAEVPKEVEALVSWPKGSQTAQGQHFAKAWTNGKASYVTVSPVLLDAVEVLGVLLHELIHAALPEAKHGKEFKDASTKLGLVGKAQSNTPGDQLKVELAKLVQQLGPYPHIQMRDSMLVKKVKEPGEKRLVRLVCSSGEKYTVYMSTKMFEESGAPISPINHKPLIEAGQEEADEE